MRIDPRRAEVWAVLSATILFGLAAPARADTILAAEGKSDCVIVVGKDASPSERFAAEELASHVKLMSGAELPVRGEGGRLTVVAIGGRLRSGRQGRPMMGGRR